MSIPNAKRTLQLLSRIFDPTHATEPFLPTPGEKRAIPLRPVRCPLPRATPESQGISSDHIRRFLQELERNGELFMQNVLILRNGQLVAQAAYGAQVPDAAKYTFSACKSITSLAVGLLVDDGLLRMEDTAADLLGGLVSPAARRRLKNLRVEDLLTMRSGIRFSETETQSAEDWLHAILSSPLAEEPGTVFHYNSLNTYLISAIIRQVSGISMSALLENRLFAPMGITDTLWERCPCGIEKGGWGLYIRPEDLAKLGQLVLNQGIWEGKQLISRAYITAATAPSVFPTDEDISYNYGYQIWVGRKRDSFLFNGMLGQNVLGFKESGILLVTNAGADTDYQESAYFEIADRYFGETFPDSLPEDRAAQKRLHGFVHSLSLYNRERVPIGIEAAPFLYETFTARDICAASAGLLPLLLQVLHNNFTSGVTSVSIGIRDGCPELIYREKNESHRLAVGLGRPEITELSFRGDRYLIAAHGHFTHDEEERPVFYIRLTFPETPCVRIIKLIRTAEGILLCQSETPGIPYVYKKLSEAANQPLCKPLLRMALGGNEDEYLRYRTERILAPRIRMIREAP